MKQSHYNFFFPFNDEENHTLAYNSLTDALALMDEGHYNLFMDFIKNGKEITDSEFIKNLKIGGYIVNDNINELDVLRYMLLNARYISKSFGLTIAPTLNCNFDCIYCYEKESKRDSHMSPEVQEKVVEFARNEIKYIDSLDITWYGGEPLLALDVIENLSRNIIDICDENKVNYSSGIITNGYKLTKNVAEQLKKLKVNFAQITLDGAPETHNRRRPLVGGQDTFDVILNNICESVDVLDKISIRINVDKDNYTDAYQVVKLLKENGLSNQPKLGVYIGYVEPTNQCYLKEDCLSYVQYSNESLKFNKFLIENGFSNDLTFKYPILKGNNCGADYKNSYVIDPDGYLYKCWSDIGINEYRIGTLIGKNDEDNNISQSTLLNYMLYDPTQDPECSTCKFLPICMGGCPRRRLDKVVDRCTEYKYTLESYVNDIANTLYAQKQAAASN